MPSNACSRSLSPFAHAHHDPDRCRPASNAGMSVRRALAGHRPPIVSMRPASAQRSADSMSPVRPRRDAPAHRSGRRSRVSRSACCLPPRLDLRVVARAQHLGNRQPPILRRPGVARRAQQPVVVRVGAGRLVVAQRAGQQPHHRVEHAERRRLAAREHEVAERQLLRGQPVGHPLVHVLVVAAEQREPLLQREPHRVGVPEPPAPRREQHDRPGRGPSALDRLEERLRLEHHPRAAAVRRSRPPCGAGRG